jgi:hypothetical protein
MSLKCHSQLFQVKMASNLQINLLQANAAFSYLHQNISFRN